MNRAARLRPTKDGGEELSLTVRCSNTDRNIFNEDKCKISYEPETCVSKPFPDHTYPVRSLLHMLCLIKLFLYGLIFF